MIDMSGVCNHPNYDEVIESFNRSDCKWGLFENIHMDIAKSRCPICEDRLDGTSTRLSKKGMTTIISTIDHYRPQKYYSFMKCEPSNYLLMCSECNNIYKGSSFPIYQSDIRARNIEEISNEKPLLVNPIDDNLLELFILVFKQSGENTILELKPKETTGYLYEKAMETIKLFGLGNCELNRHPNSEVYNCRMRVLESHFGIFYEFAKALKNRDKKKASLEINRVLFESYGFFEFLKKDQFEVLV